MPYSKLLLRFSTDPRANNVFRLQIADSEEDALNSPPGEGKEFYCPAELWEPREGNTDRTTRDGLLPTPEAGVKLWRALSDFARQKILAGPLRLTICSSSYAVSDLPWESLSDGRGPPFALRPDYQLVRCICVPASLPPRVVVDRKAVILVSRPRVKEDFAPGNQVDLISQAMHEANFGITNAGASVSQFTATLNHVRPQVVHFIGHGATSRGEGCLVFQSEDGQSSEWINARQLSKLLPPSVGLVCLSTPLSVTNYQILGFPRLAQAPSAVSLPTMVVEQFQAAPPAVEGFWKSFYGALSNEGINGDVNQAIQEAWREIAGPGEVSREWLAFSLYVRDGSGVPFKFNAGSRLSPAERVTVEALQIEAAIRARQINSMAERIRGLGPNQDSMLLREQAEQRGKLEELNERLKSLELDQ